MPVPCSIKKASDDIVGVFDSKLTGKGPATKLYIPVIVSLATEFISFLDEGGLVPNWSIDIEREIWRKLMINVAINPICAIAGVRNGALAEDPELWHQAIEAMREAEAVAKASGVDLGDSDSESYLRRVVESTAENRVSMLQDLMAGRKTEIDVLCGAVIS